ncbi:MAG: ABC transporter permease [Candidatus Parvarchaeum sp.]
MIKEAYALFIREVKKTFRNKAVVGMMIIQPIMWLAFFGSSFSHVPSSFLSTFFHTTNYIAFLLPGELAASMLFVGMFSSMSMIQDKRFGFLKRVLVTKAPKESLFFGKVFGAATRGLISIPVMMLVSLVFGVVFHLDILNLIIWIIGLLLLGVGMASVYSIITMRSNDWQTPGVVSNLINLPLMFSSTALFPSTIFPEWMRDISSVNPLSFAAALGRDFVFNTPTNLFYLLYLAIFCFLFLGLGTFASRRWLRAE